MYEYTRMRSKFFWLILKHILRDIRSTANQQILSVVDGTWLSCFAYEIHCNFNLPFSSFLAFPMHRACIHIYFIRWFVQSHFKYNFWNRNKQRISPHRRFIYGCQLIFQSNDFGWLCSVVQILRELFSSFTVVFTAKPFAYH